MASRKRAGSCSSGCDAQGRARRIEMQRRRRREPVFQLFHQPLFLLGLLSAGEPVQARVRLEFRRHGTLGAQEKKRQFLQPRLAGDGEHPGPPVGRGKIAARERELLEIILQRQPRPLRVGAGGKEAEDFLPFADGGFGIRQLAAQIGEGAISLRQNLVVSVVFARAVAGRAVSVSVSDWCSRHRNKITIFDHFDRTHVAGQSETKSFLVGKG